MDFPLSYGMGSTSRPLRQSMVNASLDALLLWMPQCLHLPHTALLDMLSWCVGEILCKCVVGFGLCIMVVCVFSPVI